jgi:hypothetical protein
MSCWHPEKVVACKQVRSTAGQATSFGVKVKNISNMTNAYEGAKQKN